MRAIMLVLACACFIAPCCASASPAITAAEGNSKFKMDEKSLRENLQSTDANTRVRSAIYLWSNFTKRRPEAEEVMRRDANPDVRRRIAQVLASKHKSANAIRVLRESLDGLDITRQSGAMSFLISAGSLQEATGEIFGAEKAIKILEAPTEWFSDVNGDVKTYAKIDAVRVMAASYLAESSKADYGDKFRTALKNYIADIEHRLRDAKGTERKYWEARLPTVLDIALRAGMHSYVATFEEKGDLLTEAYEKQRFDRVMGKAKAHR